MNDIAKVIIIVSVSLMILGGYSFSKYLTHTENIAKIEVERANRELIASLKSNKE